jgi:hypothetical protein
MPPKATALPKDVTEPALYQAGVSAEDIRAMLRCEQWIALESRNEQIVFFTISRKMSAEQHSPRVKSPQYLEFRQSKCENPLESPI